MVGAYAKQVAEPLGFTQKRGVAYGVYKKYMLTLKEGQGWVSATFAVTYPSEESIPALRGFVYDAAFQRENDIAGIDITDAMVSFRFVPGKDVVGKINNVLAVIADKLEELGVMGVECCSGCHASFDGAVGESVLIGDNVFFMHSGCADGIDMVMTQNAQEVKNEGSVGNGILGAALGAIVGAIPWAVASLLGWFVSFLGFVIGIASKKGYELLGGRPTKVKGVSVIVCSALAVVLAEFAVCIISYCMAGAEFGYSAGYSISIFLHYLVNDSEVTTAFVMDILLGWLFAGLGIFSTIREIFATTKSATSTPVRLDRE